MKSCLTALAIAVRRFRASSRHRLRQQQQRQRQQLDELVDGTLTATPGINVPVDPTIAAEVPASVKSNGTLSVAADATYAPDEFIAPTARP